MNRVRPGCPCCALRNSPTGWADTGYASYRTEIWNRWPTAGMPQPFASRADYDALVETLVATGSVREPTKLYWDVRPSPGRRPSSSGSPTLMGSTRPSWSPAWPGPGLHLPRGRRPGRARPGAPPELLRAAKWRAARTASTPTWSTCGGRARPAAEWSRCSWPRSGPGWRRRRPRGGDRAGQATSPAARGARQRGPPADRAPGGGGGPGGRGDRPLRWPRAFDGGAQGSPADRAERPTAAVGDPSNLIRLVPAKGARDDGSPTVLLRPAAPRVGHRAGPARPAAARLPRPGGPLGQPRRQPAGAGRRGPAGPGPRPVAGPGRHRGRGRGRQRPARAGRRAGRRHRRAGHGPVPGPARGPRLAAPHRLQRRPEPGLGHLRAVRDRHRRHRHLRAGVRRRRPAAVGAGLRGRWPPPWPWPGR